MYDNVLSSFKAKCLDHVAHWAVSKGGVEVTVVSVVVDVDFGVVRTKTDSALTTCGCLCAGRFQLEVFLVLC
jgi:hypothetical protein